MWFIIDEENFYLSHCRNSRRYDGLERTISSATLCQKSCDLWREQQNLSIEETDDLLVHFEGSCLSLGCYVSQKKKKKNLLCMLMRVITFSALFKVSCFKY